MILCPGGRILPEHLPSAIVPSKQALRLGDPIPLARIEEALIRGVLAATKSLHEAAEILGVDQSTLYRKRKEFGLE